MTNRNLWTGCAIAGVVSVLSYIVAISVPWPDSQLGVSAALLIATLWPVLSIFFSYGLFTFIASEHDSAVNRLAFIFAVAAFTVVLTMIVVQLTVGAGFASISAQLDDETATALKRGLRLVDLGLDVAWDMLIGMALALLGAAMRRRTGLGFGWASISMALGVALIALNAATFPWPPADAGLFDVGPLIGLYIMALAARFAVLGRRETA
jgi:hypothetical protein